MFFESPSIRNGWIRKSTRMMEANAHPMLNQVPHSIANRQGHLAAVALSLLAAVSAASVTIVSYQGASASRYALVCVGTLGLLLLAALLYARPFVTFLVAAVFLTSPLPLALGLQWSAFISAFLLSGALLGHIVRTPLRSMACDPLFLPIGIFVGFAMFSSAYGLSQGNEVSYVLGDCFQVIEFALVYFLVVQLIKNQEQVRLALRWLLVSIAVTILLELLLFALGSNAGNLLPSWEGDVVSESLVRTIDIDATILFAILINIYPVARSPRQRFWIWVALVPTIANIALSLSRGLWLCTLVAVMVSVLLQSRKVRMGLLAAFALVSVSGVSLASGWRIGPDSEASFLGVLEERVSHGMDQVEWGFAGAENMSTRRFLEMVIVGPQVLSNPWIGHGLGATYVIGGFAVLDAGTAAPIDHHFIHNLYLVTAFRMGVIGLGLLLWVLFRYFRTTLKAYRKMPPDLTKALVVGCIAGVAGQLFLSFTQPTIIDHPTCALIAWVMALSVRLSSPGSIRNSRTEVKSGS